MPHASQKSSSSKTADWHARQGTTPASVSVPTLNGPKTLRVKPGTKAGSVQRLRGEGPPKLASGSPPKRGDIHYRFAIDVPEKPSKEQQAALEALAKATDGDPRAALFEGTTS